MNTLEAASEARYAARLQRAGVPSHLHGGLLRYLVHGIQPGHFLTAVLENDLREAMGRADETSRAGLFQLVSFLYNDAPGICWGSPTKVERWVREHRAAAEADAGPAEPSQDDQDEDE